MLRLPPEAVRARATARGVAWDVEGLAPLAPRALRELARVAGVPGLVAVRGPWRDGAVGRQRLRVSRPATRWCDHRRALRALGLRDDGAWTEAGRVALEAVERLLREAGAWLLDDGSSPASAWLLGEDPGAPADGDVLAAGARLAAALGLVVEEASGEEVWAIDRLGRAWLMARGGEVCSPERALALAVEHLAGALPPWLAPEQVRVLPVGGAEDVAAHALAARLAHAGLRATVDGQGPLSSRVGAATAARVPYLVFLGPEEVAQASVRLRARGARACARLDGATFVAHVTGDVRSRRPDPTPVGAGTRCAASSGSDESTVDPSHVNDV